MHVAGPPSRDFEPSAIVAPSRFGAVAWTDFNRAYERLQRTPWRLVNRGRGYGLLRRLARLSIAYIIERNDAFLDLASKARALASLPIPRDPDIVYYGAEVGWEAYLLRALFGSGGRLVLIDADQGAYERYLAGDREREVVTAQGKVQVRRDLEHTVYVQGDFFTYEAERAFDVGLDWGLLEHYRDHDKQRVLACFRRHLKPDGVQVSAVPRDVPGMRLFYWAFADELNFGYRELLSQAELERTIEQAGFLVIARTSTPSTCIAVSRPLPLLASKP
jgi:SAM-dependent methyltransferase